MGVKASIFSFHLSEEGTRRVIRKVTFEIGTGFFPIRSLINRCHSVGSGILVIFMLEKNMSDLMELLTITPIRNLRERF